MDKENYNKTHESLLKQVPYPFLTEQLMRQSFLTTYSRNEKIVSQAGQLTYLFIILEGKARIIQQDPNGKSLILQFLEVGDFIGELTVVHAENTPKDVIAIGPVRCLAIPLSIVENLLQDADFSLFLAQYIGKKLLMRMEHFSHAQTFELKYRLAALLLEVSVNDQYTENNTQIADYLGISYRHLTYTFKYLRENGYIKKNHAGYLINPQKLRQLIQQGYQL